MSRFLWFSVYIKRGKVSVLT